MLQEQTTLMRSNTGRDSRTGTILIAPIDSSFSMEKKIQTQWLINYLIIRRAIGKTGEWNSLPQHTNRVLLGGKFCTQTTRPQHHTGSWRLGSLQNMFSYWTVFGNKKSIRGELFPFAVISRGPISAPRFQYIVTICICEPSVLRSHNNCSRYKGGKCSEITAVASPGEYSKEK